MSRLCLVAYYLSAVALLLPGCATTSTGQIPPPRPKEGLSRTFPVGYDELFVTAQSALKELNYDVTEMNRESGVIHGNTGADPPSPFEGLGKKVSKLMGARVAFRVDITKTSNDETKVQIVAQGEGVLVSKDPGQVEQDFIDGIRLQVGKIAEKKAVASIGPDKPAGAVPQEPELPPSDVDFIPSLKVKTKQNAYAVIVGVENYRDLPKVDFATRDAETVKQYLIKMLGYPEEHIILRTNERATRSDLESYFESWLKNNVEKDAEVFIYYAGHGAPEPKSGRSYLVPYDGNPSFLETTSYPVSRLYDSLAALPAKQVIVALDSCFSGAGGRSVIAKGARPMMLTAETSLPAIDRMISISAAQSNQISSAFPEKRHGLFTYYFLKGLQGEADANKDGAIELGELYNYLKPQVERQARRINQEQTPKLDPLPELLKERVGLKLVETK